MRSITKIGMMFFLGLGFSFAQHQNTLQIMPGAYDSELYLKFDKEYKENYSRAMEVARLKGWEVEFTDEYGSNYSLQGITEDDYPIYAKTLNQGSVITNRVDKLYPGGGLGLNLTGQPMTIGHWDQNHPNFNHIDFGNRYSIMDNSAGAAVSLHSTHVLGTMIGSGAGNAAARGIAYQAWAWVSSWDNDLSEMDQYASYGEMYTSNHSYTIYPTNLGLALYGAYIPRSRSIDEITFNRPFYQPVFAAGNDRNENPPYNPTKNGSDLLTSEATAKNVIVVAAVNEVPNYTGTSTVVMSSFSNWGPTDDFRIKPDISAKGVNVFSTSNTSNTSYTTLQGTSMAAPSVTATIALLQQHYNNIFGSTLAKPTMRSATVRGLLAHTASEAGSAPGPDHKFGWGLIDAEKAAKLLSNVGQTSILEEKVLSANQTYTKTLVATGTEPLVVTLSWTDRPGQSNTGLDVSTPRLVNDLDVRVTKGGQVFYPWALTKSFANPAAVKADNNVDNIEKIEIDNPSANEQYTITVSYKGNLTGGSQEYSLLVTGVDATLSNDDFAMNTKIQVYPNPVVDVFNIVMNDFEGEVTLSLYDIRGVRLSSEKRYVSSQTTMDLSSYASGMYFLVIDSPQGEFTQKVYKK